jgi:hypothetical protein
MNDKPETDLNILVMEVLLRIKNLEQILVDKGMTTQEDLGQKLAQAMEQVVQSALKNKTTQ